jgi:hypothetical protein
MALRYLLTTARTSTRSGLCRYMSNYPVDESIFGLDEDQQQVII